MTKRAEDIELGGHRVIDLDNDDDDNDNLCSGGSDEDDDEDEECYQTHPLLRGHQYRNGYLWSSNGSTKSAEDRYYYQQQEKNGSAAAVKLRIPPPRRKRKYPREIRKTIGAGIFMVCNFIATTVSLSVIHEQRPMYDPLPDQFLDRVKYQAWALDASEILLQISCISTVIVVIFHRYRTIVLRRLFFILGLLYGYRAITMFVTVLPSANPIYHCAPKLIDSGKSLTVLEITKRVLKILSGFGLSINGQHVYCGDYIYSGHTMIVVLCYLLINEYTSSKLFILHWLYWIVAMTAVMMLMLARGHYSIDIIIAYYVTTRLFWMYHSIAYHEELKRLSVVPNGRNRFSKMWWWRLLVYFESNVHSGQIPNSFSWPLPSNLCRPFGRILGKCFRFWWCYRRKRDSLPSPNQLQSSSSSSNERSKLTKHIQSAMNDIKSRSKLTS